MVTVSEDRPPFVVARLVLTVAVVLVCAIGVVRGATTLIEHTIPMHDRMTLGQLHRAAKAIAAAEDNIGDAALIGSSRTMFGFDPRVFDATLASAGHPLTTVNFGLIPMTATASNILACKSRRKLVLYELGPEEWIVDPSAAENPAPQFQEGIQEMTGPAGAALGYRVPFAVANALNRYVYFDLFSHHAPKWLVGFRRFADLYRPGDASTWDDSTHGFIPIEDPATLAAYTDYLALQTTEGNLDRQRSEAVDDGTTLMLLSPPGLARTIAQVRAVDRCSDRVILVVYPLRPTVLTTISPEARARLRSAIATIHAATGDDVIDLFDDPMFTRDDFQDAVHLSVTRGAPLFSRALALRVLPLLAH